MGETEGRFDIDALIAVGRSKFAGVPRNTLAWEMADALERHQAVVRVLRSMDRRGLLGKELRDALDAVDDTLEGDKP